MNTSYIDYRDYRDNLKLASGVAIARFTPLSVGANGKTERAWAELVSANYFDLLGVKPFIGRTFTPEEGGDKAGAYPVAVISYNMWRNRYHSDPRVLGKTIRLNRNELTIVGVAPPEFSGTTVGVLFDVWMPITMATAMGTGNGTLNYRGTRDITATIVRLKPGVTIEQMRAEAAAVARRLAAMYPQTNRGVEANVVPVWAGHLGAQGLLLKPLRILVAVCLLLLLIVCANVANLLLARAVARQSEFALRLALGAQRLQLARQLLTETLMLAAAGAAVGVLLVMWLGQTLVSLLPNVDVPLSMGGYLSWPTLGFTVLIAAVATLVSGTVPALVSARTSLNETLKEGGRGGGSGTGSHRLRGALVMAEVALAMVAMTGAGLFYRSFRNAAGVDPGFEIGNASVSQFYLSNAGYSAEEQHRFCRALRERMAAQPGVIGMTYSDSVPLASVAGSSPWHIMDIPGYVPAPDEQMFIHRSTVPPGYFGLMGIPLLDGRDFTAQDERGKPMVIVVNETFARRFFAGGNPIGRKLRMENNEVTVVGLVKDSKYHTPLEAPIALLLCALRPVVRARSELRRRAQDRRKPDAYDARAAARGARAQPGCRVQHQPAERRDRSIALCAEGRRDAAHRSGTGVPAAVGHRAVQRDELRRQPAHARDGHTRGARREAGGPARACRAAGPQADYPGAGVGSSGGARGGAGGERHAVPGKRGGPRDLRRGGVPGDGGGGGKLPARAQGDTGGPDAGAEVRVGGLRRLPRTDVCGPAEAWRRTVPVIPASRGPVGAGGPLRGSKLLKRLGELRNK